MIIASSDLDKIQIAIEKEKVGHGADKGQLYLGDGKDDAINVKVLMDEKVSDSVWVRVLNVNPRSGH